MEISGEDFSSRVGERTLGEILLEPTRIYVRSIRQAFENSTLNALAHITGGGLVENLPRVIPDGLRAVVNTSAWQRPEIFDWLQDTGNIDSNEMYRTFNCGIGMVLCVPIESVGPLEASLKASGEEVFQIGEVTESSPDSKKTIIVD